MLTNITGNIEQFTNFYYVYHVQNAKEILYIGYAKLQDIISFKQIIGLTSFDRMDTYTIVIHDRFSNRFEAINSLNTLMSVLCKGIMPPLNREVGSNKGKQIMCNETQVVYGNAYQACRALNIPPARMSNHLQHRKGHKTIHGLTFKYV